LSCSPKVTCIASFKITKQGTDEVWSISAENLQHYYHLKTTFFRDDTLYSLKEFDISDVLGAFSDRAGSVCLGFCIAERRIGNRVAWLS
jgi:hypothetical protein